MHKLTCFSSLILQPSNCFFHNFHARFELESAILVHFNRKAPEMCIFQVFSMIFEILVHFTLKQVFFHKILKFWRITLEMRAFRYENIETIFQFQPRYHPRSFFAKNELKAAFQSCISARSIEYNFVYFLIFKLFDIHVI